jgi:SNF2 family DNA or RNA helicase
MPRTQWLPDNKYCKRSKIPEDLFCVLITAYFSELMDCMLRKDVIDLISVGLPSNKKSLSAQSIGRYFDLFGKYVLKNVIVPIIPDLNNADTQEKLFLYFYDRIENSDIDFYFPAHLSDKTSSIKTMPFKRSFMYLLLARRTKMVNGFKESGFIFEYSRAAFVEAMLTTMNLQYYPNDLFIRFQLAPDKSYEYHKLSRRVNTACYACLRSMLETNPLG